MSLGPSTPARPVDPEPHTELRRALLGTLLGVLLGAVVLAFRRGDDRDR